MNERLEEKENISKEKYIERECRKKNKEQVEDIKKKKFTNYFNVFTSDNMQEKAIKFEKSLESIYYKSKTKIIKIKIILFCTY